jgi:ubiquinone/menaquinone biosynthesis C-methylase UbiE
MKKGQSTSWGGVADWYNDMVLGGGSYQKDLLLPNLLRLVAPKKDMTIVDVGCGQGFFSHAYAKLGAQVIGIDIAPELIALAKNTSSSGEKFFVNSADDMKDVKSACGDVLTITLALQNIERVDKTLAECSRVLKRNGKILMVLNHPCFRIPKESSWGWDEKASTQYRRVDQYLSESRTDIAMHPGKSKKDSTVSFHRPLQFYFKMLQKNGFAVTRLEEWESRKKSEQGPRQRAEDRARKEIPLFLYIEAVKV